MATLTLVNTADMLSFDGGDFQAIRGLASSSDGTKMYACSNLDNFGILKSTDNGQTWTASNPNDGNNQWSFTSIACSSNGNILYACNLGNGMYKSTNAGATWTYVYQLGQPLPGGAANPEVSANYDGGNVYQVACDATGNIVIMTTNYCAVIYRSTDGGVTWNDIYLIPDYNPNANSPNPVAMNVNGSIMYVGSNNTTDVNTDNKILKSVDNGATWTILSSIGTTLGPFNPISTNLTGDFVFGCNSDGLNIFYETHADLSYIANFNGSITAALTNYSNGNGIVVMVNNAIETYEVNNVYPPGPIPTETITCFKEGSKLLCSKYGSELYMSVQDIRKGDLVKTRLNGYVPVNMIGSKTIYHPASSERIKDQLYKCSPDKYPELTEDLILTGCHSILTDRFISDQQREDTIKVNGDAYVTDRLFRLPACVDDRTSVYDIPGVYKVYHLALDHDDYYMNYGIYANGLLVETCSKRYLKELSGMTLVE